MPQSFRDRIAEDNALDVELYEFAKELVASRCPRRSVEVPVVETDASDADRPLISVVIPTYQRAELLERSLESLTAQTVPRDAFEVVVVDDGSSDWTARVCKRLSEELHLRYFRIENSGISAAKNLGLFASQAPLVLWFDDDDIADPGLLQAHLDAHEADPEENIAVLGYTTWASELEVTPLMEYVTEIGKILFSYPNIEDGQTLDYTYFWGGRSSCKRCVPRPAGSFDQGMPGARGHGARLPARQARPEGHLQPFRQKLHGARRQLRRVRAAQPQDRGSPLALQAAPSRAGRGALHPGRRSAREVALARAVAGGEGGAGPRAGAAPRRGGRAGGARAGGAARSSTVGRLRRPTRGIAEAAAEDSDATPEHLHAFSLGSTDAPVICPEPIFIIGAPRSGTSILAWSLAQHSELWTEAESDIFFYMLKDGLLERAFETSVDDPTAPGSITRASTLSSSLPISAWV